MTRTLRNLRTLDGASRRVMGTPWRGYLGSEIPVGSAIYSDLSLPADNDKDYVLKIGTWPSSGTLFLKEDGSPIYTPVMDGSYTASGALYENTIFIGNETLTFNSGAVGTITTTPGNNTAAGVSAAIVTPAAANLTVSTALGNADAQGARATILQAVPVAPVIACSTIMRRSTVNLSAEMTATINLTANLL